MAYNIFSSNNTPIATIEDGTIDNSTSLTLIGKNFAGFGPILNENFVHLLENFASDSSPDNPLPGQLWYDTSNKILKLRTVTGNWKSVVGVTASAQPPDTPTVGDQWWHLLNNQLYSWNGNSWDIIGPSYSAQQGITGSIPSTIRDTDGTDRVVIKHYINDIVVGIWSKEETPYTVQSGSKIAGFFEGNDDQIVKPGLTLANVGIYDLPGLSNIPKNMIWGTTEKALAIGDNTVASFVRRDPTGDVQTVSDTIELANELALVVVGNIEPADDKLFDVGSTSSAFNNIYSKKFVGEEAHLDQVHVEVINADTINLNGAPIGDIIPEDKVGDLTDLDTTEKTDVVSAINELKGMWVTGMIMMWSGNPSSPPTGWALCNGALVGSYQTPDLRDKFIVGAGNLYNLGVTGGNRDAVVVEHTHSASTSIAIPPHGHNISGDSLGLYGGAPYGISSDFGSTDDAVDGSTHITPGERSYMTLRVDSTSISATGTTTIAQSGESKTDKNLPPYYALCFIVKLPS